jgi:hypothetical protein
MANLYVIGDRKSGVLFIKTDPLKLTHISKATMEAYAAQKGTTYDSIFSQVAAGAKAIINKTEQPRSVADLDTTYEAIGQLIGKGTAVSDVDFCFSATINDTDWSANRLVVPPLASALATLNPTTPSGISLNESNLD